MRRGEWARELDRILAEAWEGVALVADLVRQGMLEGTVYRRCRDGGPWRLLAPATVLLSSGTPTRRQLLVAALLYAGPDAMITGLDAARAHGMRRGEVPEKVHVLVPASRQIRSVRQILVERTHRMPTAQERDGLPVAPLVRCINDAVRRLRDESDIAAIMTEPVQRGQLLPEALGEDLDTGCRKGSATPRAVLRGVRVGVRSAAEYDVRAWWLAQPELPRDAEFNMRVVAEDDDRFIGIADLLVRAVGLVVPVDSVEQHFATPEQVEETERQHRAYRSAGLHVASLRPSRTRTDSAGLLRDMLDAIAVAAELPPARIRCTPDLARPV